MSIEVHNITKSFGNFRALDDVSLQLPAGELIALLGPSGCGKTTLLRIVAGLEMADAGRIVLEGQDASNKHVRDRHVGFVFQHYALFRHMTVFENIAFGLRVKPRAQRSSQAAIRAKVEELLSLVQLDWTASRFPAQLSGGQRQRIALARALAVEPRVLLLDEPFGALDAKVRKELRRWLRRLHEELHITTIFVTHDQDEAMEVADRVVLLNQGHIEQVGTVEEVYQRPASEFAAGFLGAVNRLVGKGEGSAIRFGDDHISLPEGLTADTHVVAYARPHELEIRKQDAAEGISAKVGRIVAGGTLAKVELTGLRVLNGKRELPQFEVEVPHEQLAALQLRQGETVKLTSSKLKVFPYRQ